MFTPFSPEVAFGSSESLGWVFRVESGRWVAQTPNRVRVAAFPSRKEAAVHLVELSRRAIV